MNGDTEMAIRPPRNKALRKPLEVFKANQEQFAEEHHGEFVVIHKDEVVGFYREEMEGYAVGVEKFGLGEFLLQECVRDDDRGVIRFHSRVGW